MSTHHDLRSWLEDVDKMGELKTIQGAHWDLEMSAIIEIMAGQDIEPKPAVIFDDIPGYPKGFRNIFGLLSSVRRISKTIGLSAKAGSRIDLLQEWRDRVKDVRPIPPEVVTSGPVQTNVDTGDNIDLLKFPVPRLHELDGGRYFGTCAGIIQQDPDTGFTNVAAYRSMLVDRNHLALHILEGQHGSIIMNKKYFAEGKKMPVAIAVGMDPTLWFASFNKSVPWGVSEYDYTGGLKGMPVEVFKGEHTGLLLPAHAEIIVEGECDPEARVDEGPFGEWNGYYANMGLTPVPEPVVEVKAVYYRDNPIFTCELPTAPHLNPKNLISALGNSEGIWARLEKNGIPGVKGVWSHSEVAGDCLLIVVSIEQLYPGHSREVGLIASQYPNQNRYTIVVDEDIDPSNLKQVIWAVMTRGKPHQSIQILDRCRTGSSDPTISQEEKRKYKKPPKPLYNSRAVIDACQPLEWKDEWYPVCEISRAMRDKVLGKWRGVIDEVLSK